MKDQGIFLTEILDHFDHHVDREASYREVNISPGLHISENNDEVNFNSKCKIPKKRKLILHFDLRNTVIVADSVTNIDIEQAINSYLTGVLWGREERGQWIWISEEPSLTPPERDCMTYYKYLERSMVSTPSDRAQLRLATGDFTKKEIGAKFRPYFDKYLPMLKWNKPMYNSIGSCGSEDTSDSGIEDGRPLSCSSLDSNISETEGVLTMSVNRKGIKEHYHYIIPSFVRFLKYLCEEKRNFVIIIRTYGMDAPNVLSSIKHIVESCSHPDFPHSHPTPVCSFIGDIKRFRHGGDHKTKLTIDNSILNFSFLGLTRMTRERRQTNRSISSSRFSSPLSTRKRLEADDSKKGLKKIQHSFSSGGRLRHLRSRFQQSIKTFAKGFSFAECNSCCIKSSINSEFKEKHNEHASRMVTVCGDGNISDALNNLKEGIYAFVDDFTYWQNHSYNRVTGKPLWITLPKDVTLTTRTSNLIGQTSANEHPFHTSETHHHIFFDDNIRVNEEDSIVDVRLYDWNEGSWRSTTGKGTELCEDVFLVQANLLESLENKDYFIEKLQTCEMKLDQLLNSAGITCDK